MRYLAVDPGGRRMGLAVGDSETGLVSPLAVVPYRGAAEAAAHVAGEARRLGAVEVVVGLPTLADGRRGGGSARSEKLARELESRGLRVHLQAEHLTTDEARRRARAAGRARGAPVDDLAALVILEEFLAGGS